MKLRIATYKNRVTATQVKAYADKHSMPLQVAKELLVDESYDILEYWKPYDNFGNGYWVEVPREDVYRNEP